MALLNRKTEEEKEAERRAKEVERRGKEALERERATKQAELQAQRKAEEQTRQAAREAHLKALTRWEYQVKRVGEDKQKGLSGSQRMEQIFNAEGEKGWELVTINEERATFKRPLPPSQ